MTALVVCVSLLGILLVAVSTLAEPRPRQDAWLKVKLEPTPAPRPLRSLPPITARPDPLPPVDEPTVSDWFRWHPGDDSLEATEIVNQNYRAACARLGLTPREGK